MKKLFLAILFCLISLFGLAQSFTGVTASGTDTYAITVSGSSYFTNQSFEVRFTNPNTGVATLAVTANGVVQAAKVITTDGSTPVTAGQLNGVKWLSYNGTNFQIVNNSSGSGTVSTVSVVSANGLAGTVANPTTTPAITLSTTINGLVKGNGTAFSAASAGTDYEAAGIDWRLSGTSTLTGVATITSNAANQHIFNGTWSAAAATDAHMTFGGTLTAASALGVTGYLFNPTLNAVGTSSVQVAVDINPPFAGGTTPVNIGLRVKNGGVIIGNFSAFQGTESLLIRKDQNAATVFNLINGNSNTNAADAYISISTNATPFASDFTIGHTGVSFSTSGAKVANTAYVLQTLAGGGLNVGTTSISQASIWTNSAKRLAIDANGLFIFTQGTQSVTNTFITFTQSTHTGGTPVGIVYTQGAHATLAASVESLAINFNTSTTVQYATGAQALLRNILVQAPTIGFVGASTITDNATFTISGAPKAGTNTTQTNTHGLLIQAGAVTSAGSAYGATINAPTGGTANYAAQFLGGNMGVGLSAPVSTLDVSGSFGVQLSSTSTDITLDATYHTVLVSASGANRTITLPASSGCTRRIYRIKKTDATANTVTIDGNASETIDGALTKVVNTQYAGYAIQSDGSNWSVIATF